MSNMPEMQEAFDAMIDVSTTMELLFFDMEEVVKKHVDTMRTEGKTNAYWDDVAAVAEKYGLQFTHPKFAGGLKTVTTRPTVH